MRYPYWCIRVGKPFGRLILQGLKPWETRVDYKEKPRVLASLPAGTIVLVYLDDLAFPPNASAEVREATEADIAELLSRQNKEVAADSAPGQFGTICAWIRLGASWSITEEEVANMGGWCHVENMTLLKKERLVFYGDPGSCRWVTEVEEAGLLRYPIAMTEKTLEQRGLFRCPSKVHIDDLLPMPTPRPSPTVTTAPPPGLGSGSFRQVALRAMVRDQKQQQQQRGGQQGGGSSGEARSSSAARPPAASAAGHALDACLHVCRLGVGCVEQRVHEERGELLRRVCGGGLAARRLPERAALVLAKRRAHHPIAIGLLADRTMEAGARAVGARGGQAVDVLPEGEGFAALQIGLAAPGQGSNTACESAHCEPVVCDG